MAITVTDATGATIPGVRVAAEGPTQRGGETNGSGQANFPGLQGGVYRLRFDGDAVVSFEKEVTVRGGQVLAVDVMLNPAKKVAPPPPAPVAAPPPPVAAKTGPAGQPQQVNIPNVLEAEFVGKNPRRESLLACSGDTRSAMLQVNQPTPERMYADADVVYYVIGGEGTLKLNGKETQAGAERLRLDSARRLALVRAARQPDADPAVGARRRGLRRPEVNLAAGRR